MSALEDRPVSAELQEIAELFLYDGDTDEPLNDGYGRLHAAARRLAAVERERDAAEARREAVKAWLAKAEPYPELNGNKFAELRAALSVAPVLATNESALTTIVRVLSETYTDAGVLIWLNAKNKQLPSRPDGNWFCSPAEYIAAGHAAEVLDCARRIEGSS